MYIWLNFIFFVESITIIHDAFQERERERQNIIRTFILFYLANECETMASRSITAAALAIIPFLWWPPPMQSAPPSPLPLLWEHQSRPRVPTLMSQLGPGGLRTRPVSCWLPCTAIVSPHLTPPPWWLHYHVPPSFFFFSGGMLNVSFIFVWSWIVSIFSILLISFYDRNFSDNQCWSFPPVFSEFLIVLFFFHSQKYYSSRLQSFSVSAAVFMAMDSCRHLQIASTLCLGTPPPLPSFSQVWDQLTWVVDCCLFFCLVAGVINLMKTCLQCFGPQLLLPMATAAHHHLCQLTLASNK